MTRRRNSQSGFTVVELVITTCIVAVLASVAIREMRDYSRRATVSEVIVATSECKNMIAETYLTRDTAPEPGTWGCERPVGTTRYSGAIQTSENGVIRVEVANIDRLVNGRHIYLVPARGDVAMVTPTDLGNGVRTWICGSDWPLLRNALPASCRADTTTYSSQDFQ